jgi:hypothetical protein
MEDASGRPRSADIIMLTLAFALVAVLLVARAWLEHTQERWF